MKIALSSASENYINWVHRANPMIEIADMKSLPIDSALLTLATCDGLIMTGGEDVVPSRYGKAGDSARCETNPHRDSLEFELIKKATSLNMPLFGVCRGQQILNVAFGGTLIVDIPTERGGNVSHRCDDYLKCFHSVSVLPGSTIHKLVSENTGNVTSNHHQAIEKLAPNLRATSWSDDGIIESVEYADVSSKPFFLAVQWHPERMDTISRFSMPLIQAFVKAANKFGEERRR